MLSLLHLVALYRAGRTFASMQATVWLRLLLVLLGICATISDGFIAGS